jgi:maleylacetoacetate isomerase
MMTLYSYFRSSTAYRARIALNLKGIEYNIVPVNILKGDQHEDGYRAINAIGGVPALKSGDTIMAQSLAIAEYLDDLQPDPPLVFGSPEEKAYLRQIALTIACDIHPLINLKVIKDLKDRFKADEDGVRDWILQWVPPGVRAVETLLRERKLTGLYALGNRASLADLCIVPQMYSMRRFKIPVEEFPLCRMIEKNCLKLPAFQKAAPEVQPDTPADLEPIHGPGAVLK